MNKQTNLSQHSVNDIEKTSITTDRPIMTQQKKADSQILSFLKRELLLKFNTLNIHIIATLVKILIALMQKQDFSDYYQFIASAFILSGTFAIHQKLSTRRLDKERINMLNILLQVSILCTDLWMMTAVKQNHFQSKVSWAVCLVLYYCLIQVLAIIFNLPLNAMVFFQIVSVGCIIINFERQEDTQVLRFQAYPLIVIFNILPFIALREYQNIQNIMFKDFIGKKQEDTFQCQKVFADNLYQPLLIMESDFYTPEKLLFMNKNLSRWLIQIINSCDKWQKQLIHHSISQKCTRSDKIDLIAAYDLLKLKFFVQKDEFKKMEYTGLNYSGIGGESPAEFNHKATMYSLDDLLMMGKEKLSAMTLMIQWPNSESYSRTKRQEHVFCMKISDNVMVNDKKCKIIQFIEISKNLKIEEDFFKNKLAQTLQLAYSKEKSHSIGNASQGELFDIIQKLDQGAAKNNISAIKQEEEDFKSQKRLQQRSYLDQPQPQSVAPVINKSSINVSSGDGTFNIVSKNKKQHNEKPINENLLSIPAVQNSDVEINMDDDDDDHNVSKVPVSQYNSRYISGQKLNNSFSSLLSVEQDNFLPNILIADDNMLELNNLESVLKNVIGPDGRTQIVNTVTDGIQLEEMYCQRLELSLKTNWEIRPYQIIIADLHMPGLSGLQASEKIQMHFLRAISKSLDNESAFHLAPCILIQSNDEMIINQYQNHQSEQVIFHLKPLTAYKIQTVVGKKLQPLQEIELIEKYN